MFSRPEPPEECAAEDCEELATRGLLCERHDLAESDALAERLMEMDRDDPL